MGPLPSPALAVAKVFTGLRVHNGQGVTADAVEAERRLEEDILSGWSPDLPMQTALKSRKLNGEQARMRVRRMIQLFRRIVRDHHEMGRAFKMASELTVAEEHDFVELSIVSADRQPDPAAARAGPPRVTPDPTSLGRSEQAALLDALPDESRPALEYADAAKMEGGLVLVIRGRNLREEFEGGDTGVGEVDLGSGEFGEFGGVGPTERPPTLRGPAKQSGQKERDSISRDHLEARLVARSFASEPSEGNPKKLSFVASTNRARYPLMCVRRRRGGALSRALSPFCPRPRTRYPLLFMFGRVMSAWSPTYEAVARPDVRSKKLSQREWTVAMALPKPALGWRIDQHGDMLAYFVAHEAAFIEKGRITYHASKHATAALKAQRERSEALAKSQVEHHRSQERARQERMSAEGKEFVANASDVYIPAPASLDGSSLKQQDYVDNALHVTAVNGSPSFLITMTLDVNHPDITENLGEGQTANTRPDVTAMVAHRAFERLLYFVHGGMFGENLTTTATVEWQARGLPHLHLIVTNERQDRVLQAADADRFTTCEAPDDNDDLLNLVARFMQHKHKAGECCEAEDLNETTGELHDKNARCKQGFPRPLAAYTHEVDEGGELLLRCRGRRVEAPNGLVAYDRMTTEYNPALLLMFRCHINFRMVVSAGAQDYLFKYIMKTLRTKSHVVEQHQGKKSGIVSGEGAIDERRVLMRCLRVGAHEGMHRLLGLSRVHVNYQVAVVRPCLPRDMGAGPGAAGEDSGHGEGEVEGEGALGKGGRRDLAEWFAHNARLRHEGHPALGMTILDFVRSHARCQKNKVWRRRIGGLPRNQYSRLNRCSALPGTESFALRSLLVHVKDACSYEDLRTVDGVPRDTFQEACVARGLDRSPNESERVLEAAAESAGSPAALRKLFACLLTRNALGDEIEQRETLYDQFTGYMLDDLLARKRYDDRELGDDAPTDELRELVLRVKLDRTIHSLTSGRKSLEGLLGLKPPTDGDWLRIARCKDAIAGGGGASRSHDGPLRTGGASRRQAAGGGGDDDGHRTAAVGGDDVGDSAGDEALLARVRRLHPGPNPAQHVEELARRENIPIEVINELRTYDYHEECRLLSGGVPMLDEEGGQREAMLGIMRAVDGGDARRLHALLAAAGTGKSFVCRLAISFARLHGRKEGRPTVACGTTALAGILIGALTAHIAFGLRRRRGNRA